MYLTSNTTGTAQSTLCLGYRRFGRTSNTVRGKTFSSSPERPYGPPSLPPNCY